MQTGGGATLRGYMLALHAVTVHFFLARLNKYLVNSLNVVLKCVYQHYLLGFDRLGLSFDKFALAVLCWLPSFTLWNLKSD